MNRIVTKLQLMWHLNIIAPYSIEKIKTTLQPVISLHGIRFDDEAVYFNQDGSKKSDLNTRLDCLEFKIPYSDIIYCGETDINGCVEIISRRYFVMYLWPDREGQLLHVLMKAPYWRSMFDYVRRRFRI